MKYVFTLLILFLAFVPETLPNCSNWKGALEQVIIFGMKMNLREISRSN
jgi:hypothetical protein